MRIVAVMPFAVDGGDPQARDLAHWLSAETAWELCGAAAEAKLVVDPVQVSAASLGDAAGQVGADFGLGAVLTLDEERLALQLLLADARGAVRAQWDEPAPVGAAPQLGRRIARRALAAMGEDAAAPPATFEPEMPAQAILRLCRAARREDVDDLLALTEEFPALAAASRALLHAAQRAIGGERMPALFSALERLTRARPDDPDVLLALGDYRALHLDEAGARELYLRARDAADDPRLVSLACLRLASVAESTDRTDEAIQHLRAAIRLADDPRAHARLGTLLLAKEPAGAILALTRATVLAPDDAALHLALARALREHGRDPARALAAATRAAHLAQGDPSLADEVRAELELLPRS
jgi:tetratricopeptide (TPR) repeat protein